MKKITLFLLTAPLIIIGAVVSLPEVIIHIFRGVSLGDSTSSSVAFADVPYVGEGTGGQGEAGGEGAGEGAGGEGCCGEGGGEGGGGEGA
ncbi:MAG: hypothetical protein WAX38_05170 [Minisyncoccia bacterium]